VDKKQRFVCCHEIIGVDLTRKQCSSRIVNEPTSLKYNEVLTNVCVLGRKGCYDHLEM
jgi:hypothetical protein